MSVSKKMSYLYFFFIELPFSLTDTFEKHFCKSAYFEIAKGNFLYCITSYNTIQSTTEMWRYLSFHFQYRTHTSKDFFALTL